MLNIQCVSDQYSHLPLQLHITEREEKKLKTTKDKDGMGASCFLGISWLNVIYCTVFTGCTSDNIYCTVSVMFLVPRPA